MRIGKPEEIDKNRQDDEGYYGNVNATSATDVLWRRRRNWVAKEKNVCFEANLDRTPLILEVQRKLGEVLSCPVCIRARIKCNYSENISA